MIILILSGRSLKSQLINRIKTRSFNKILSIAARYKGGTNCTGRFLILEEWNTFLATAAVVVEPPKPLASGKPNATPETDSFFDNIFNVVNLSQLNCIPTPIQIT